MLGPSFGVAIPLKLLLLPLCFLRCSSQPLPSFASLTANQWVELAPASRNEGCLDSAPFKFQAFRNSQDASFKNLVIWFQGGGGCWDDPTCLQTYRDPIECVEVSYTFGAVLSFDHSEGIFNVNNQQNPLRGYSVVYVPYCSADVHIGDNTKEYGGTTTLKHEGAKNVKSVLDWVFQQVSAPQKVVVGGLSAGGYAAYVWSASVKQQYPDAHVFALVDAANGVSLSDQTSTVMSSWGAVNDHYHPLIRPHMQVSSPGSGTRYCVPLPLLGSLHHYIEQAALDHGGGVVEPTVQTLTDQLNVTVAVHGYLDDQNQVKFYRAGGGQTTKAWRASMLNETEYFRQRSSRYATYISPGTDHGIMEYSSLFTENVDSKPMTSWIADLLNGQVYSVVCATCYLSTIDNFNAVSCLSGDTCGQASLNASNNQTCSCHSSCAANGNCCGDYYENCISYDCSGDDLEAVCWDTLVDSFQTALGNSEVSADCSSVLSWALQLNPDQSNGDLPTTLEEMSPLVEPLCDNNCFDFIFSDMLTKGCGVPEAGIFGLMAGMKPTICGDVTTTPASTDVDRSMAMQLKISWKFAVLLLVTLLLLVGV